MPKTSAPKTAPDQALPRETITIAVGPNAEGHDQQAVAAQQLHAADDAAPRPDPAPPVVEPFLSPTSDSEG